jgi:hypothetical protein
MVRSQMNFGKSRGCWSAWTLLDMQTEPRRQLSHRT